MKYSLDTAWQAVGKILPSYTKAKDAGFDMNLPQCLEDCAITILLEQDMPERLTDSDWGMAKCVVKSLLEELHSNAWIEFGDKVIDWRN